jgi:hypothetical protein
MGVNGDDEPPATRAGGFFVRGPDGDLNHARLANPNLNCTGKTHSSKDLEIMSPETLADAMRWIGFATAWFCAALAFAVFVVLLVAQHNPLIEAVRAAMPLAVFALLGAFGAGMTRYLAR